MFDSFKLPSGTRNTRGGSLTWREIELKKHIPYDLQAGDTIIDRMKRLIKIVRFDGFSFSTDSLEDAQTIADALNLLLHDSHIAVYSTLVRRRDEWMPPGTFSSGVAKSINDSWCETLKDRGTGYVNDLFLTVVRADPAHSFRSIQNGLNILQPRVNYKKMLREFAYRQAMHSLDEVAQGMCSTLENFGARVLGTISREDGEYSEMLALPSYILNHDNMEPILLPGDWDRPISDFLSYRRPKMGYRAFLLEGVSDLDNVYGAVVTLDVYSQKARAGMFDALLSIEDTEHITTHSFVPLPTEVSRLRLEKLKNNIIAAHEPEVLVEDVEDAIEELVGNKTKRGAHHVSSLVFGPTPEVLEYNVQKVREAIAGAGCRALREDTGLEIAMHHVLPGNFHYSGRPANIDTNGLTSMTTTRVFWRGNRDGSIWGPPLDVFPTPNGTKAALNLHPTKTRTAGHTLLIGKLETGKSTLVAKILNDTFKEEYGPVDRIILEAGNYLYPFVSAHDGQFWEYDEGQCHLNPLQLPGDGPYGRSNINLVRRWLAILAAKRGADMEDPKNMERIVTGVRDMYKDYPAKERWLENVISLFGSSQQPKSVARALEPWIDDDDLGGVFNNRECRLLSSFGAPIVGHNLGALIEDDTIRAPTMVYFLHCIMQRSLENRKMVVCLDEPRPLFNDPMVADFLDAALRIFRKRDALVLATLHDITADIFDSKAGKNFLYHAVTKGFFPNARATKELYVDREEVGLTETQLDLIHKAAPTSRQVLLVQDDRATVLDTNMKELPQWQLDIMTGKESTIAEIKDLRGPDNVASKVWLPQFRENRQEA